MKSAKWPVYCVAMIFALILTVQPVAQAGQNLENWPVVPDAKGDRSVGQLTIYYEVIDESGCVTPLGTEPSVRMIFFLRLYEKSAKVWHVITAADNGPFCLTGDAASGLQQTALESFLDVHVRPRLIESTYAQVLLKDVEDDYENIATPPVVPPYCVSAEITIVAQD